ncbi:MAG: 16S rRNA (cytosine(967)-C(5))-methyltransferase RsmB [Lachnospirales bacterium]
MKNNEREISVYVLMDIFETKGYNNIVLKNTLSKYDLGNKQKAFITETVNGTLRNLILIDYIINYFSKTKTKKMKAFILNLLRISVYQMKYMDKVPPSAICNEAVKLTKKKGFGGLSGFVNGVLRNIDRNLSNIEYPTKSIEKLALENSIPMWLINYWNFKEEDLIKLCNASNKKPVVSIATNTLKISNVDLRKVLDNSNVTITEEFGHGFCVKNLRDYTGNFHVIDKNAIKAIEILNPKENEIVLDMCAAPGGKSFMSSYLMKDTGKIIACDIYEHKLNLINDMQQSLGITNIETQLLDGTILHPDFENKFHKVIADVPCSGFGLIQKKPDIKYNKTMEDINSLIPIQRKILENASKYVKVGGRILYSTCTISKKENEENIHYFLNKFNFKVIEEIQYIMGVNTNNDGFYICVLERKA